LLCREPSQTLVNCMQARRFGRAAAWRAPRKLAGSRDGNTYVDIDRGG
jgi:hypothetical protein